MNYKTMGQMEVNVKKLHEEKKQIYVVQGNLDDKKVRQLPKVNGYILVTGNVFFTQNGAVPGGLIVLGNAEMQNTTIKGNGYVYGECKAQRLIVHGTLATKAGATQVEEIICMGHNYI